MIGRLTGQGHPAKGRVSAGPHGIPVIGSFTYGISPYFVPPASGAQARTGNYNDQKKQVQHLATRVIARAASTLLRSDRRVIETNGGSIPGPLRRNQVDEAR